MNELITWAYMYLAKQFPLEMTLSVYSEQLLPVSPNNYLPE